MVEICLKFKEYSNKMIYKENNNDLIKVFTFPDKEENKNKVAYLINTLLIIINRYPKIRIYIYKANEK